MVITDEEIFSILWKAKGIKNFLSDWCVTCINAIRINSKFELCGTGCNGVPPFRTVDGEREFLKNIPIKYEEIPSSEAIENIE